MGAGFELSPILKPLEPVRDHVNVLSGLSHLQADTFGDGTGDHPRASAVWLTGVHAYDRTRPGVEVRLATTADQLAAREIGKGDPGALARAARRLSDAGSCDSGDCFYVNTVSWRNPTTPNPAESHPRIVFERLFGDGGSAGRAVGAGEGNRQPSRFGHAGSAVARQSAGTGRHQQAERIPGFGPRNRAAHSERGGAGRAVGRVAGSADRHPGFVRGAHQADAGPGGAGLSGRHHSRLHDDLLPRAQHADVPEHRRAGAAPSDVASPERPRADREEGQDRYLSRPAAHVFPDEVAGHAGRRRLAARSQPDHVRRRDGRRKPAPAFGSAVPAGREASAAGSRPAGTWRTRTTRRWRTCWSPFSTRPACGSTRWATAPGLLQPDYLSQLFATPGVHATSLEDLPQTLGGLLPTGFTGSDRERQRLPRRAVGRRLDIVQAEKDQARAERALPKTHRTGFRSAPGPDCFRRRIPADVCPGATCICW